MARPRMARAAERGRSPAARARSDAWVHAGIAWDLRLRGIPPGEPRFAGLPLNYVWCFDLFIAALQSFGGGDPFLDMALHNTAAAAALVGLAYALGWQVWRT